MSLMRGYVLEAAYSTALEGVAMGATRAETDRAVSDGFPSLTGREIDDTLLDALHDALKQGVEREDIDPSWL